MLRVQAATSQPTTGYTRWTAQCSPCNTEEAAVCCLLKALKPDHRRSWQMASADGGDGLEAELQSQLDDQQTSLTEIEEALKEDPTNEELQEVWQSGSRS